MSTTRRQFLQVTSTGLVGTAAVSGLTTNWWGLDPDHGTDPQTDGDQVIPTFCEICFWKCGVLAHVKDGRVTKLVGNPDHPMSNGRLCPRGTTGTGLLYDPDRLKTPLIRRTRDDGEQYFEEASWEEALDLVARRLGEIRDKHGAKSVAYFNHGHGASWFKSLFTEYGTPNVNHTSYAQCRGARQTGFELTFGQQVGSPEIVDIENARVITFIGSHLGENMHNTQVQELAEAVGRGADLIVVDPRFSTVAGKARHWLPIKPGTDLALLLAWMHVIIGEDLYDHAFVEANTVGFEQLTAHVADKTPEWAFTHTTIRPELIRETARLIAGARPASLVHPGRRTAWYGDDAQRSRAIAILDALVGSWGARGGFFVPDTFAVKPHAATPHPHLPEGVVPADMPKGTVYPFASSVLSHGVRDASVPGTGEYDIKAWFVYGTDLLTALPDREKTLAALHALELVVVVDVLPIELTGYADVVLPEATYLERHDDLHNPGWKRGYVAIRQPVVEPMYDSRPGWWIAKELANRMEMGHLFPWDTAEQYLRERVAENGLDYDELSTRGVLLKEPGPIYFADGIAPRFPTPSGKVELYSQQLADLGQPPMPEFTEHEQPGPGQFRLLFGRAPMHSFGRTTNNRVSGQLMAENELWLNAQIAAEMGLHKGQRVVLVNQDGVRSDPIKLRPTQRIRPDCVYMVHGFGHNDPRLAFGYKRGASDAQLITQVAIDPLMGGTGMNVTFVSIDGGVA